MGSFHNFGATNPARTANTVDALKAALYLTTGTIGAATTVYTASGEVTGTNYTAGGIAVTNATAPSVSGTTAIWTPSAALVYSSVTLSTAFDTVLMYNSSQSNRAILAFNFGSTTVTAGTLTLNMPANAAGTALINLA
jgi:2-oxoglutarate dehydrogenase complex dehydrogenase (E1) component-like enzyme